MPICQGSIVPSNISFRFHTGRCNGRPSDQIPFDYFYNYSLSSDQNFSNLLPNQNTRIFNDDAIAVYNAGGTTPLNQISLQSLGQRFAQDWLDWFNFKYDITYNGTVAPTVDATMDTIEFTHTSSDITTRVKSSPYLDWIRKLSHWDAYFYSNCHDVYSNDALSMVYPSGTPSFKRFIPGNLSSGGVPIVPKVFTKTLDTIIDYRMMRGVVGTDPTKAGCDPCCLTKICIALGDLCYLVSPVNWAGSMATITRLATNDIFYCTNFVTGVNNSAECCLTLPRDVASGEKFNIHVDTPIGSCDQSITIGNRCTTSISGFDRPGFCASGCATSANGLGGIQFTFFNGPCVPNSASCTTNSSGCCCIDTITYGSKGSVTFHDPYGYWQDVTANTPFIYSFSAQSGGIVPVSTKHCSCACNWPVNRTLHLTDPWGTTTLTYSDFATLPGTFLSCPGWSGTSVYNAILGGCGTQPINYLISNGGCNNECLAVFSNSGGINSDYVLGANSNGLGPGPWITGYIGTMICADPYAGTALLWTGQITYSSCSQSFVVSVTE